MDKLGFLKTKKNTHLKNRQLKQQRNIIRYLAQSKQSLTIPEIVEHLKISFPTGLKLIKKLVADGYVLEEGKRATDNGRRPALYSLNYEKSYVVGVEILPGFIQVSVLRLDLETIHKSLNNKNFKLTDTADCVDYITKFIQDTIKDAGIKQSQVMGVGVGMIGNNFYVKPYYTETNSDENKPANYFKDKGISLQEHLENTLQLPVLIDNDTRTIAIAEQVLGLAKGVDNVLVVKVSSTLGLSLILNRRIFKGSLGFAGNFKHTQFDKNSRLCVCGKKGCLGTIVGGYALKDDLAEALNAGETSLHFQQKNIDQYRYHDILDAVLKGDEVSIQLIQNQGTKLGMALGNLLNLFDPDLVLISGEYVMVQDFFLDAVKTGLRKTALLHVLNNCAVEASTLGRYLSSTAGACMFLKACDMIEY